MSGVVDIFNFNPEFIKFAEPVSSTSQEGGVTYQKVYYNYNGNRFYLEIPTVDISISKNTKKKYEAYSSRIKLSTCKQNDKVVDIFNKIYAKTASFIEANKTKLNFKNKNKFKADKAEECGLSSALYYLTDKETGEKTSNPPMLFANMVIDKMNKSVLKYPTGPGKFTQLDWKQYVGFNIKCIPILTISNIFIGSDGSLRIQLQFKSATILEIQESQEIDQSESISKYEASFDFSKFKLPEVGGSSSKSLDISGEDVENLEEILNNGDD